MKYSKRHLNGLPSPTETVVKSLSEYMKLFSSGKYKDYVSINLLFAYQY